MGVFTDALTGSRWVVVVRRGDDRTFQYPKTRLAGVRGVEVTVDRRSAPDDESARGDRRRGRARFNAFGVLLARR